MFHCVDTLPIDSYVNQLHGLFIIFLLLNHCRIFSLYLLMCINYSSSSVIRSYSLINMLTFLSNLLIAFLTSVP